MTVKFPFDNSYTRLPERFYTRTAPTPVAQPQLIKVNVDLAIDLGLNPAALVTAEGVEILAGNRIAGNSDPIATAYAGHQFGGWVPQLGDGRAILLGELIDRSGVRRDIQLKGSGRTPFSRGGDGRAAVGPVVREYLISEAMYALGIPTTRSLAAVATGEPVFREEALPGAVLTRVAASHIRVGTFQYFANRNDYEGVKALADHVIARHYPTAQNATNPYRALLDAVITAQATLIASWMHVGFIHGVMNTDNMAITGETIDYGPCAFMDEYNPAMVFSSIDRWGRYAYGNQPAIAEWNLTRLAECLLPLIAEDAERAVEQATESLTAFGPQFKEAYDTGLLRKIGLIEARDIELARELLQIMTDNGADFTLTFRRLCDAALTPDSAAKLRELFVDPRAIDAWLAKWRERLRGREDVAAQDMKRVNPAFIPRNHRVEAAIRAAIDNDYAPFEELHEVLKKPYDEQPEYESYSVPPLEHERVRQTFCGT